MKIFFCFKKSVLRNLNFTIMGLLVLHFFLGCTVYEIRTSAGHKKKIFENKSIKIKSNQIQ